MGKAEGSRRELLGAVIGAVGVVVAVAVILQPPSRAVGRIGLGDSGTREITVRCRPVIPEEQSWGGAAGRACQGVVTTTFTIAGLVAVLAGIAMFALLAERRRGRNIEGGPGLLRPALRGTGTLLIAVGVSSLTGGLLVKSMLSDEIVQLNVDDKAISDSLRDDELRASFEVIGLGNTSGGRYDEERWWIVDTSTSDGEDTTGVRDAFGELGWSLGAVPEGSTDGWVEFRGLAGEGAVDQVEVGLLRDALSSDADISVNARRILEMGLSDDAGAVAIHLVPSPLAQSE